MEAAFGVGKIRLTHGDITRQRADVIVNAANDSLSPGAGVNGAILAAGGPAIQDELDRDHPNGCPTGSAVLTKAGRLPAQFVAHAVGPIWQGGQAREADQLASAYRSSFELAAAQNAATVACPAISTGIYGYPVDRAAPVALQAAADFLKGRSSVREIVFVLFDTPTLRAFESALQRLTSAG